MLMKKKIKVGTTGDIHYIEGIVSFQKITLNVYSFLIDGLLIDTGAPRLLPEFKTFFTKHPFEKVVLTHSHEDHVGGAAYLQQKYDVPILMHDLGIENCTKKADYPFYRKFFWGKRAPFHAQSIDRTIQSRHMTWDVIETPGHAADHISLFNRQTGQLFTGDLFVYPRTKLVLRDESIPTMIESIKSVLQYPFEEIICCHAGYVKNGRDKLKEKLQYLEDIQGKIIEMDKEGYAEKEIQSKLFEKKYPITYISFGEWDSLHIIRSVLREAREEV